MELIVGRNGAQKSPEPRAPQAASLSRPKAVTFPRVDRAFDLRTPRPLRTMPAASSPLERLH
jgi:hypothetical protein